MDGKSVRHVVPKPGFESRIFRASIGAVAVAVAVACAISLVGALSGAQRVATAPTDRSNEMPKVTIDIDDAPLALVLRSIARQAGFVPLINETILPPSNHVTLHVQNMSADNAFQYVLRGTGLRANILGKGDVAIIRDSDVSMRAGIVIGRVIAAATKQPLHGAKIGLDDAQRVVESQDDGSYRIADVRAGSHTVTIKLLGYAKVVRSITVRDDATTTVDAALELSATPLGQMIVTGTVIPTELKAVPNAITVITAKQLEERGITRINQLFRGDVPGLFAQNTGSSTSSPVDEVSMYSRGATALSSISQGTDPILGTTNTIKTYVDGVELADAQYLSQIDPQSIERIEILTGPQASTIYGSNAINGVMQIFTKRGNTQVPQLTLNLQSGWVENNFSSARTPQHDYSAQVSGIEGRMSYNVGGSWNYMGPWTPAKRMAREGGFGGVRFDLPTKGGRVTTDFSLRRMGTQNKSRGSSEETVTALYETGVYKNVSASGLSVPNTTTLAGQTLGLTISYAPTTWWSHELVLGWDVSDTELRYLARGYNSRSDTTLNLSQTHAGRRSFGYATTARSSVTSFSQLTLTAGLDGWQNLTSSLAVNPQSLTGTLSNFQYLQRQPGHNTGGFLQTQLSVKDQLFLTYGVRAEWNPDYGSAAEPNYAPRYGMAYTRDLGHLTAKVRASYGRTTRPPAPGLKATFTVVDYYNTIGSPETVAQGILPYYGSVFDYYLANPALAPETQKGGEGGVELYWGSHASMVITRYNQTVDNLIARPAVDSVYSLVPCPSGTCSSWSIDAQGYGAWPQYQYLNLGSIRNQGWEGQGSATVGPLTARGTYSWTKSRIIGIAPQYRAYFADDPTYQRGGTFQYLPEHTWAWGVTYARARSAIGLNVTGTGRLTIRFQNDFNLKGLSPGIRLPQNRFNVSNVSRYVNSNAPYTLADLNASQRFGTHVEAVLQVQNLGDKYVNDYYAGYASLGRQVKGGFRIRTQ